MRRPKIAPEMMPGRSYLKALCSCLREVKHSRILSKIVCRYRAKRERHDTAYSTGRKL